MTTFLARICAFKFFDAFILISPLYVVMFADAGLSPVQIGVCLTVWSATNFALQIPSGVIADRWSRRHVLAFAQSARAAGFIVWMLYPHFWGFLAGLVLWGVKSAFTSGTFEALLYDELKARDQATRYMRVIGQARAAQAVAVLAAAIGAALAAPYGYPVCIAAGLASTGAAMAAALNLPPAQRALLTHGHEYLSDLRRGLPIAIGQPAVLSILVFSALVLAFGAALEEFWPIFGAKVGLARPVIALFVGAQNAIEAMVSLVAWRVAFLDKGWFHALFALGGALLLSAAALFTPPAMALLALYSGLFKIIDIVFEGRLQQLIPSNHRATIGSVKSLIAQIGLTGLYMSFGPIAQATSYRVAFAACGCSAIAIGLTTLAWPRRA